MRVRAVLFDAGNTLIRVRGSVGDVYAAAARRHGVPAEGAAVEAAFREVFGRRRSGFVAEASRPHSPARERAWWREVVGEVFGALGLLPELTEGFDAFFGDLYLTFERPEVWEVFPDVLPALDALAGRGLPVAVVSNWDSRLHAVLRGLGLAPRLAFALTSAEFGAEKPHPSLFAEAVRRLGLVPGEVLHVGDLLRDDVEGARSAGLQALLLDRSCPEGSAPERICSLSEVVDRLAADG